MKQLVCVHAMRNARVGNDMSCATLSCLLQCGCHRICATLTSVALQSAQTDNWALRHLLAEPTDPWSVMRNQRAIYFCWAIIWHWLSDIFSFSAGTLNAFRLSVLVTSSFKSCARRLRKMTLGKYAHFRSIELLDRRRPHRRLSLKFRHLRFLFSETWELSSSLMYVNVVLCKHFHLFFFFRLLCITSSLDFGRKS